MQAPITIGALYPVSGSIGIPKSTTYRKPAKKNSPLYPKVSQEEVIPSTCCIQIIACTFCHPNPQT